MKLMACNHVVLGIILYLNFWFDNTKLNKQPNFVFQNLLKIRQSLLKIAELLILKVAVQVEHQHHF